MATLLRMSIHQKIAELREAAGLRQEELAKLAGLTATAISRIENDKVIPRKNTLRKIAKALGTSIDDLLRDTTAKIEDNGRLLPEGLAKNAPNAYLDSEEIAFIKFLRDAGIPKLANKLHVIFILNSQLLGELARKAAKFQELAAASHRESSDDEGPALPQKTGKRQA